MEQQDVTYLMDLKAEIAKHTQRKIKLAEEITLEANKIVELQSLLVRQCNHSTVIRDKTYTSGGYDYVSKTEYFTKCTICNHKEVIKTVLGSFQ